MGQGQGSFQTNAKFPPGGSPGPPFLLNSADNGLSVDPISKRIVLGQSIGAVGNPARLLNPREIPLNGQSWEINDTFGNRWLVVDAIAAHAEIGVHNGVALGDGTTLILDDGPFTFGWTLNTFNLTANTNITQSSDSVNNFYNVVSQGNQFLLLDFLNNVYKLGDIDGHTNRTLLTVDDAASQINAIAAGNVIVKDIAGNPFLGIGMSTGDCFIGDDNGIFNGVELQILQGTKQIIGQGGGGQMLSIDNALFLYKLGDIGTLNAGTKMIIDDNVGEFQLTNTALTSKVRINGVIGFTGTVVNPVTITVDGGIVTNVA